MVAADNTIPNDVVSDQIGQTTDTLLETETLSPILNIDIEKITLINEKLQKLDILNQRVDDLFTFLSIDISIALALFTALFGVTGILLPLMNIKELKQSTEKADKATTETQKARMALEKKANEKFDDVDRLLSNLKTGNGKVVEQSSKDSNKISGIDFNNLKKVYSEGNGLGTVSDREQALNVVKSFNNWNEIPEEIVAAAAYHANEIYDYNLAVKLYNYCIRLKPDISTFYNNLGVSYAGLKQNDEAIKSYKLALEKDSENLLAYFNLGKLLFDMEVYEEALEMFQMVIKLAPREVAGYNHAGLVCEKMGDYGRALKYHEKAYQINPNELLLRYNIVGGFLLTGEFEKARVIVEADEELLPNEYSAKMLGHFLLLEGKTSEAIEKYKEAISRVIGLDRKIATVQQMLTSDIPTGLKAFPDKADAINEVKSWLDGVLKELKSDDIENKIGVV